MKINTDASQLIGNTPMLHLKKLFPDTEANVLAKLECSNPTSIKDRAVLNMISTAIAEGKIKSNTEVVEASSGNTAIAIASLGAAKGYKTRIYMSKLCSVERQQILCAYGAKVILTPGIEHTKGARKRAIEYCNSNKETTFFVNQHGNENNGKAHEFNTGPEIWEQTQGSIDAVIIGLGTSGTFDGISRFMKNKNNDIKIIGFEPAESPVYSGGEQGIHRIIGIGPGFITDNFKRSKANIDELLHVKSDTAYSWARKIASTEGILVGPSSGAAAFIAGELIKRDEFKNKNLVCFFYDTGERYMSTDRLFPADNVEEVD